LGLSELKSNIKTIKAKLPMETEEMVELTDIEFDEENKTIVNYYKVYFYKKSEITEDELDFFIERRKNKTITYAKNNIEFAGMFLDNDISFKNIYHYKNGDFMAAFIVKPKDYK
jgi:alpha-D-ribose 1-methylphosphonate 5-triphosphate diphosphatase PhnM